MLDHEHQDEPADPLVSCDIGSLASSSRWMPLTTRHKSQIVGGRRQRRLLNLIIGLNHESITNPVQCMQFLHQQSLDDHRNSRSRSREKNDQARGSSQCSPSILSSMQSSPMEERLPQLVHNRPRGGELVELEWRYSADSSGGVHQYQLDGRRSTVFPSNNWACKCLVMSIDEMHWFKKHRLNHRLATHEIKTNVANCSYEFDLRHYKSTSLPNTSLMPNISDQINESGCKLTRRKLMKLVGFARKFRRQIQMSGTSGGSGTSGLEEYQSQGLYELELQTDLANEWLAYELARIARHDLEQLHSLACKRNRSDGYREDEEEDETISLTREHSDTTTTNNNNLPPIGARLVDEHHHNYTRQSLNSRSSSCSSSASQSLSSSSDSGISLVVNGSEISSRTNEHHRSQTNLTKHQKLLQWKHWHQLESHLELRASHQFRAIISYSWQLFNELLMNNSLLEFRFDQADNGEHQQSMKRLPLTLNQLRVFARVECQKLRARLRFEWVPKCFWLAFETGPSMKRNKIQDDRGHQATSNNIARTGGAILPSLYPSGTINDHDHEQDFGLASSALYLEAAARLMGHLLRRHFLEAALDKWLKCLREHFIKEPSSVRDQKTIERGDYRAPQPAQPKLIMKAKLIQANDATNEIASTCPERDLKEALAFVVDEIGSVCLKMPRIECQQFEEQTQQRYLIVLADGDELLLERKQTMGQLIDLAPTYQQQDHASELPAFATTKITQEISSYCPSWISRDHLRLINIVNKFRTWTNDLDQAAQVDQLSRPGGPAVRFKLVPAHCCSLIGFEILKVNHCNEDRAHQVKGASGSSSSTSCCSYEMMNQLELTCKQIKLLDELEYELKCQLDTSSIFGQLIELDLSQLNEELAKIIAKERLLLVRFKTDELFKLMEALRKQFDELELNIDLDAAIEDYLDDRWRVKQSQQPGLEQQILLDDEVQRAEEAELDQQQLPPSSDSQPSHIETESSRQTLAGQPSSSTAPIEEAITSSNVGLTTSAYYSEEDELLSALVNRNNPKVAHLFAMSDPTGGANLIEQERSQAAVAPLIECRLLVERYKYLNNFLSRELDSFVVSLGFCLVHGLGFLCEFGWLQGWQHGRAGVTGKGVLSATVQNTSRPGHNSRDHQYLESEQLELLAELSLRAREFSLMLGEALQRLQKAHARLVGSMELRANVLNRTILEFDWLMRKLAERHLEASSDEDANIKQLDFIQDTASWSVKLSWRLEFLACQNELIERESRLLFTDCQQQFNFFELLQPKKEAMASRRLELDFDRLRSENEVDCNVRSEALAKWRSLGKLINEFWLLTEAFETQQVKWLNSDSKKLDFHQVEQVFEMRFEKKLADLREDASAVIATTTTRSGSIEEPHRRHGHTGVVTTLMKNLDELQSRLGEFRRKCMPILRFMTSKHLTDEHWLKLHQLLQDPVPAARSSSGLHQIYTTVAQVLELGVTQELVAHLDQMSHQATIEHELAELIGAEVRRSQQAIISSSSSMSVKSQIESLAVLARLDSWNQEELALAAARFIRIKMTSHRPDGRERDEQMIGHIARQLVECHVSVKRSLRLSNELNLETSSLVSHGRQTPDASVKIKSSIRRPCTVVVRSRLASRTQRVDASLLVELLRLFTEFWLEAETRLTNKLSQLEERLAKTCEHLVEIDQLLGQVDALKAGDSKLAICANEHELAELQRGSLKLELEREIMATSESASLELQSEAIRCRDACIKQISERAIPAIRAATRALDCLGDGRPLRALRSYRPSPPLAIRLVIEAVCLLRNVCCQQHNSWRSNQRADLTFDANHRRQLQLDQNKFPYLSVAAPHLVTPIPMNHANQMYNRSTSRQSFKPFERSPPQTRPIEAERRFDPVRGLIIEDYWPIAWRTLNGVHTSQFVADLRRVSQGTRIPSETMALIRRKYLRRPEFQLAKIERHSREAGQLARWLLAVDVFERVISIVRPNYDEYLKAEASLSATLANVSQRRGQIETIGRELENMEESIRSQVNRRVLLVDLLDDCVQGSRRLTEIRAELMARKRKFELKLIRLRAKIDALAEESLWTSSRLIYLEGLPKVDQSLVWPRSIFSNAGQFGPLIQQHDGARGAANEYLQPKYNAL